MPKLGPIHFKKLAGVFEKKGFVYVRTRGDHLIYQKVGLLRPIVIPKYKEIPEFIIACRKPRHLMAGMNA